MLDGKINRSEVTGMDKIVSELEKKMREIAIQKLKNSYK